NSDSADRDDHRPDPVDRGQPEEPERGHRCPDDQPDDGRGCQSTGSRHGREDGGKRQDEARDMEGNRREQDDGRPEAEWPNAEPVEHGPAGGDPEEAGRNREPEETELVASPTGSDPLRQPNEGPDAEP